MAKNYFGITDTGKQRTNNEDTFIAEALNNQFIAACVIDGLGGYEGGEVAAALAREAIVNTLSKKVDDVLSAMKQAIIYAGNSIQEAKKTKANENYSHMACVVTLSIADIEKNKFYYAHVGDTRLYLLRDRSLIKITKDQSFVGFLEDNGRLTETEAMQHPKRNEINKALGFDIAIDAGDYIETGESPFLPGDMLMLCSDGLTDMVNSETMSAILNSNSTLENKAAALVGAANEAGGNDNITVVLVQNDKEQMQQTATRPATQKRLEATAVEPVAVAAEQWPGSAGKKTSEKNLVVPVLSVLLVLAFCVIGWLYYKTKDKNVTAPATAISVPLPQHKRNAAEQVFMDSINKPLTQTVTINVDSGTHIIVVSDTIFINKDSLVINGNGARFIPDSSYKGPAFVLSDNCNYIVFEHLSFSNFDAAILSQQPGLHLRNIKFSNCKVPVMQLFEFPSGVAVSGSVSDTIFRTNSLRK